MNPQTATSLSTIKHSFVAVIILTLHFGIKQKDSQYTREFNMYNFQWNTSKSGKIIPGKL